MGVSDKWQDFHFGVEYPFKNTFEELGHFKNACENSFQVNIFKKHNTLHICNFEMCIKLISVSFFNTVM